MGKNTEIFYLDKYTEMIKISHRKSVLLEEKLFFSQEKKLQPFLKYLRKVVLNGDYEAAESFMNLPGDKVLVKNILEIKKELVSPKLKYVIVIGIGGSILGTQAIYDALVGTDNFYQKNKPKLIFFDTNSPRSLLSFLSLFKKERLSLEEIVVNIVCKSGSTIEPLTNFEIIYQALSKHFKNDLAKLAKRVVTTVGEGSELWKISQKQGFKILTIPKSVGGRYSVFSAVGLFPLCLAGIDIKKIQEGALDMTYQCLKSSHKLNPALISSIALFLYSSRGINIVNTFIFNMELESFGKWYRQLIGESLGKRFDLDGKKVRRGLTPITSLGSVDLHSMLQLFLDGPQDKFTFFIHSLENSKVLIPRKLFFQKIVPFIAGKDVREIMRAILKGTQATYQKEKLPFLDITLSEISPYSISALMQLKMIETILLAKQMNINAFDQPNVESYKSITKQILQS